MGLVLSGTSAESSDEQKRKEQYWQRIGVPTTFDRFNQAAARVDVSKPIGEYEAYVLARAYYGGCGGIDLPKRKGDFWVAKTYVGYAGLSKESILVNRKTGVTVARGFPEITDPKLYLKPVTRK